MEKFKTEFEENLIKKLDIQMHSVEFSAWIIGMRNDWISEEGKQVLYERIKSNPLNSIKAMKSYFEQEKERAFSANTEEAILECYAKGLRPLVENLDTKKDLEIFVEIRKLFFNTKENNDFLFEAYCTQISPSFKAKRKEVVRRLNSDEPLSEEEIEYMDKFYGIDVYAYKINSDTINSVKTLYKKIEQVDSEKIKHCVCFKKLFDLLIESPEKFNGESFLYCMKLQETELISENLKQDFMKLGEKVNIKFSEEAIKEFVINEEKRKFLEEFYKDNPDALEEFKNQVDRVVIDFLNKVNKKEKELTDNDKKFYEEYLKSYFKESFKKYKYEEKGFELFDAIRESKIIKGEIGEYFKEQYGKNNIWNEFTKEVIGQKEKLNRSEEYSIEELKKADFIFKKANSMYVFLHTDQIEYLSSFVNQLKNLDINEIKKMYCMEHFICKVTEKSQTIFKENNNNLDKVFNLICNYVELIMEKDENAVFNFDSIDYLNQLVRTGRLPEKYIEQLRMIFEKNKVKLNIQAPNMEVYEEKVSNFEDMNEEEFSRFMQDVKKIIILNDMIPEKYCDYLIAQKINSESCWNQNIYKYFQFFPIFQIAFKDKAGYVLKQNDIEDYVVRILGDEYWDKKDTLGQQNSVTKTIDFRTSKVYEVNSQEASIIRTIFHEVHHAYQNKQLKEEKFNKITYNILKENIIKQHDSEFYNQNYTFMQNEIDARITGSVMQYNYLKKIGLSTQKIVNYDVEDINTCLKELVKLEFDKKLEAKEKKYNGEKEKVDIIFQNIIKNNPELIEQNPILGIEFDLKGNRKGNMLILKEYEKALNIRTEFPDAEGIENFEQFDEYERLINYSSQKDRNYLGIYTEILRGDAKISDEQMLNDILEINNYNPEHKAAKFYFDFIIRQKILPEFEKWKKEGKIDLPEDFNDRQNALKQATENLYKYAIKNPNQPTSKKILEVIGEEFELKELEDNSKKEKNLLKEIDVRSNTRTKKTRNVSYEQYNERVKTRRTYIRWV